MMLLFLVTGFFGYNPDRIGGKQEDGLGKTEGQWISISNRRISSTHAATKKIREAKKILFHWGPMVIHSPPGSAKELTGGGLNVAQKQPRGWGIEGVTVHIMCVARHAARFDDENVYRPTTMRNEKKKLIFLLPDLISCFISSYHIPSHPIHILFSNHHPGRLGSLFQVCVILKCEWGPTPGLKARFEMGRTPCLSSSSSSSSSARRSA